MIQSTSATQRRVDRLGDRLVERDHLDLDAALAQRVGQHVAALARAHEQHASTTGTSGERLDHALGDGAVRDDVGDDAVLAQRPRGARPHRGDAVPASARASRPFRSSAANSSLAPFGDETTIRS